MGGAEFRDGEGIGASRSRKIPFVQIGWSPLRLERTLQLKSFEPQGKKLATSSHVTEIARNISAAPFISVRCVFSCFLAAELFVRAGSTK